MGRLQCKTAANSAVGGRSYCSRMAAVQATTYALRSINYESSDLLVVFRIVRFYADGSLLPVWKKFKDFPLPTLR